LRTSAGRRAHPDLVAGGNRRLSIRVVCLEAGCSRNALYDGHSELLAEIKSMIIKQERMAPLEPTKTRGELASKNFWLLAVTIDSGSSLRTPPCY
jgi:hypothetical protein